MVDPQAGVAGKSVPEVVPESVNCGIAVDLAQRVEPALLDQPEPGGTHFGSEQSIVEPAFGFVDVPLGRHDVEVADKHHRQFRPQQLGSMYNQPLEPAELVVELWT